MRLLLFSFALIVPSLSYPFTAVRRQVTCATGLYIIGARGTDEAPGLGKTTEVVNLITSAVPGSSSVAVDYPATWLDDGTYFSSVTDGVNDAIDKIQAYVDQCGSDSNIVLTGFSQGANVMTSVLAGGFDGAAPISSSYNKYITGVVVFGDPTFTSGQSFDAGSSDSDGIFSRDGSSLALLNTFADVLRSYCDSGDPFCAEGLDEPVHSDEVPNHADDATTFIASLASS